MTMENLKSLVGLTAACTTAYFSLNFSPFILGGLVDGYPMGLEAAGALLSAEVTAMGLAAVLLAPMVQRLHRGWTASIACAVLVVCNMLLVTSPHCPVVAIVVVRVLAGVAAGALLTTVNIAMATSSDAGRTFSLVLMSCWVIGASLGPLVARALGAGGYRAVFGCYALCALISVPLVRSMPNRNPNGSSQVSGLVSQKRGSGLLYVGAVIAVAVTEMAYFSFVERACQHLGLSLRDVGTLESAAFIAGAIGAGAANTLIRRVGCFAALYLSTAIHAGTIALAMLGGVKSLLVLGVVSESFSYLCVIVCLLAVAAELDDEGKWAAVAGGALVWGAGLGPYLGANVVQQFGLSGLAWLNVLPGAFAILGFAVVQRRSTPSR